jgi:F0F1-type ATP synthase membrane subunit c/vacuolar-type H+-ATPase subunit K
LLLISRDIVVIDKFYWGLSNLGIAAAISISSFVIGIVSSFPVRYACLAIARQPFMSAKIINIMMLTLSFIQTPIIFGFIISLFINYQAATASNLTDSIRHIASGISIGIGSIGPVIGLALFSKSACQAIGYNKEVYNKILTFTFVSEALIETPIVFALVTSLLILTTSFVNNFLSIVVILSAAFCTGISNIMPGISSGKTASIACQQIASNPDANSLISRTSMLAQGLIDSFAIYGWLVSLLLIFFVK